MKNTIISLLLISLFACQDVVQVDLKTAKERLVIEALIKWKNNTIGNVQTIKLSNTSSYYNNQRVAAIGANVKITNKTTLQEFNFVETQDGIYKISNFVPILNNVYALEITYKNQVYKAEEALLEAPEIIEINQTLEGGFSTEYPEVNIAFNDFENQEDYYRIIYEHYRPSTDKIIETVTFAYDSRFEQDNQITDFFESEDFETDDEIEISLYSITHRFYTFLNVLESQADSQPGPFSLPPVNVKGNCINTTNSENYPYGYFSLFQMNKETYIFQ